MASPKRPHAVIVGAGFGGLACARALGGAEVDVTVIDRRNYHLFVPLLYQVATAGLSPADIAQPIRRILARHTNIEVMMGEVVDIDKASKSVRLADGDAVAYDKLVLAPGSSYDYFGYDEQWSAAAPGPRNVHDARVIRERLLIAFERAEQSHDPEEQQALLTTVIVGGGPTGVEMAGSVAELTRFSLRRNFRHIDPTKARIVLVEAGPRILSSFPEELADHARQKLESLGVTVVTGEAVENIEPGSVTYGGRTERAGCIVWGAGVRAVAVSEWLGVEAGKGGTIAVRPDLSVPGHDDVYVIGDTAAFEQDGKRLPALAQVAHQQGGHLGRALRQNLVEGTPMPPFRFQDRGNTAIVGRNSAVFDFGRIRLKGRIGWILWAIVHIYLLTGFEKRLVVATQWFWRYLTYQSGARIIVGDEETIDRTPEQRPAAR